MAVGRPVTRPSDYYASELLVQLLGSVKPEPRGYRDYTQTIERSKLCMCGKYDCPADRRNYSDPNSDFYPAEGRSSYEGPVRELAERYNPQGGFTYIGYGLDANDVQEKHDECESCGTEHKQGKLDFMNRCKVTRSKRARRMIGIRKVSSGENLRKQEG